MPSVVARGERLRHYVDCATSISVSVCRHQRTRYVIIIIHIDADFLIHSFCPFDSAGPFAAAATQMSIANRNFFYIYHSPFPLIQFMYNIHCSITRGYRIIFSRSTFSASLETPSSSEIFILYDIYYILYIIIL